MKEMTKKEVATLLNVSERTVTRKVKEGKIIMKKKGKRVYFPSEQFDKVEPKEKDNLNSLIETLQKQLEEKDKQIQALLDKLGNEQVITKTLQDRVLSLPERVTEMDTKKENKGFWKRVFS